LKRLEQFDPKLRCVITLTKDLALAQAKQADAEIAAGKYRPPLMVPNPGATASQKMTLPSSSASTPQAQSSPQSSASAPSPSMTSGSAARPSIPGCSKKAPPVPAPVPAPRPPRGSSAFPSAAKPAAASSLPACAAASPACVPLMAEYRAPGR
jgi:hypothetical protein